MAPLKSRIGKMQEALTKGLIERSAPVRLALLAALAGEHLLLVGPPGTAKSELARRIHWAFEGAYFERLLTRFSVPEELFGPLSIKKLEADCYERLTEGYLPMASIAFIDEIFKANSAILNSMLTLLNERKFDNGTERLKTPLICVVAASNELPKDNELDALYDRFLLRYQMNPVSPDGFTQLIDLAQEESDDKNADKLSVQDLKYIQREAQKIGVADEVKSLLADMREFLQNESIKVSDRRWRKIVGMLKVSAYTNGANEVSVWDCWILQHCLWDKPEEREKILNRYQEMVRTGRKFDSADVTSLVSLLESAVSNYQNRQTQAMDKAGNLLYKEEDGGPTTNTKYGTRGGALLYRLPKGTGFKGSLDNNGRGYTKTELKAAGLLDHYGRLAVGNTYHDWDDYAEKCRMSVKAEPLLEPMKFHRAELKARCNEADELIANLGNYKSEIERDIQSLSRDLTDHLWVDSAFAEPASANLQASRKELEKLLSRAEEIRKGFEGLPIEGQDDDSG